MCLYPPAWDLIFSYSHLWKICLLLLWAHVPASFTHTYSVLSQITYISSPKPHASWHIYLTLSSHWHPLYFHAPSLFLHSVTVVWDCTLLLKAVSGKAASLKPIGQCHPNANMSSLYSFQRQNGEIASARNARQMAVSTASTYLLERNKTCAYCTLTAWFERVPCSL